MTEAHILAALRPVVAAFEQLGIRYQIGGSVASTMFGVARSTLDVDLVADIRQEHVGPFVAALHGDYYAPVELIGDAIRHRTCFNLIYLPIYFKVDVFVRKDTPYEQAAFAREVEGLLRVGGEEGSFRFSTPEDIVLHKLQWFEAAGGSDRQWSDLLGLLRVQGGLLDEAYLRHWAAELSLLGLLERAFAER